MFTPVSPHPNGKYAGLHAVSGSFSLDDVETYVY